MGDLVNIINSDRPEIRNTSLESYCRSLNLTELINETENLDSYRRDNPNLYHKVRALFFLYSIHRFYIPASSEISHKGLIPYVAYNHMLKRRYEEAIDIYLNIQKINGPNEGISSGLAEAYHKLAFKTLANQVRKSVRSTLGNQWMFRAGHPDDHPLSIREELIQIDSYSGLYPVIHESTPVRMDISHSGWSDIFFLGMDFPEGARVLNISVNLKVRGRGNALPKPPIETFFRIIDQPVLRLTSVDLGASTDISLLSEVFDFAKDYLGLLKAAIIASGIIPPGMEGAGIPLNTVLNKIVGPGLGIEIISKVNNIPKGSRLAVSTNLLASLISVCMRASNQTRFLTGPLDEEERRLVAARAILGEWLGGSGGGWQDSGGIWPGIKIIKGVEAIEGDPEFGISKGRLLPDHTILNSSSVSEKTRKMLQDSLVIVHGGMAQDVGPILEMVTEKYLLRSEKEWQGRLKAIKLFDKVANELREGKIENIGGFTQENFDGPIQTIIPWSSNLFTETLITRVKKEYGSKFWGFWMMGGMSGGGMGFMFDPGIKNQAQDRLQEIMSEIKNTLETAIPFAMDPVVYDFSINETGSSSEFLKGEKALLPEGYYTLVTPGLLKREILDLTYTQRKELEHLGSKYQSNEMSEGFVSNLFDRMIPQRDLLEGKVNSLESLLAEHGFDQNFHHQLKIDLQAGRIGLSQNRLAVNRKIEDVSMNEVFDATKNLSKEYYKLGLEALNNGELGIVTLAGGLGSRWTKGAGVVKSLNPFAKISGKHRNFIEAHLAKNQMIANISGTQIPHILTTSYLTHQAISDFLNRENSFGFKGSLYLSPGRVVGLRMIPMERDLRFLWEEMPQHQLDEQAQKVQDSLHKALINWAKQEGEGEDYRDNLPHQCIHPVGHWYEIPNMMLNGTLKTLLGKHPDLKYLLVHNIDTLGANPDPALLGYHIKNGNDFTVEVISRKIDDRGGGLAKIDGKLRLVEGLALPDEKIEFDLTYYNSGTYWINIDRLLSIFKLSRKDLNNVPYVHQCVMEMSKRMPTYITIKDVKKRWGKGQEDIFPVTQFEKLWGDMTTITEFDCSYMVVPRFRGQQLKEIAQLDGWLRDGSAEYLDSMCEWN
jgi:UDP-N-acetylglucosamine pyrophosphorylase